MHQFPGCLCLMPRWTRHRVENSHAAFGGSNPDILWVRRACGDCLDIATRRSASSWKPNGMGRAKSDHWVICDGNRQVRRERANAKGHPLSLCILLTALVFHVGRCACLAHRAARAFGVIYEARCFASQSAYLFLRRMR